jgi:hypothetical protein
MGTFGTAIFSDDFACDIRDEFKELLGDGLSSQQATGALMNSYAESLNDPDEATVFWLALAAVQWKTGRLLDYVKTKAIAIIEDGSDLERWRAEEDEKLVVQRNKQLLKLKEQLLSQQPSEKKIAKYYKEFTPFEIGDVFSYAHSSGNFALMRVIGHSEDEGGRRPDCELLNFFSREVPTDVKVLEKLPYVVFSPKTEKWPIQTSLMTIGEASARYNPKDKIKLIAKGVKGQQPDKGPWAGFLWRNFDERLTDIFINKKSSVRQ